MKEDVSLHLGLIVIWLSVVAAVMALLTYAVHIPEAHAGTPDTCYSVGMIHTFAGQKWPKATLVEMGRDETEGFLRVFNAHPPISHATADYALVIDDPSQVSILVVLFSNGCASPLTGRVSRDAFQEIMKSL